MAEKFDNLCTFARLGNERCIMISSGKPFLHDDRPSVLINADGTLPNCVDIQIVVASAEEMVILQEMLRKAAYWQALPASMWEDYMYEYHQLFGV